MNKKAAISVTFCGLDENAGELSSRKGDSRTIDNRTFFGWTAIGVTRLHVFRENALLLYYLGVLGSESATVKKVI